MGREIALDAPGQGSLLDRLLDVVLVSAIRSYAAESPGRPGSWLTTRDPLVTAALELMHEDPARGWTLESLARAVRGSRASDAEPPPTTRASGLQAVQCPRRPRSNSSLTPMRAAPRLDAPTANDK